jgi:hypothetical protein
MRCGEYSISLMVKGVPVLGSPFALKVASARPSLARCSAEGLGLSTARVGDAAQFVVTLRNGDGHEIWLDTATTPEGTWMRNVVMWVDKAGGFDPLSVRIESFDGHRATATIHECTDQVGYAVSYQVVRSGTWKIDVRLFGEPIPGSPFELPIEAGDVCAEACRASGDGLTASEAGSESSFVIQPMDRNGNLAGPMPAQLFRVVALLIQPVSPADMHHVRRPIDLAVHAESHGAPRSQCAAPTCHVCTGILPASAPGFAHSCTGTCPRVVVPWWRLSCARREGSLFLVESRSGWLASLCVGWLGRDILLYVCARDRRGV